MAFALRCASLFAHFCWKYFLRLSGSEHKPELCIFITQSLPFVCMYKNCRLARSWSEPEPEPGLRAWGGWWRCLSPSCFGEAWVYELMSLNDIQKFKLMVRFLAPTRSSRSHSVCVSVCVCVRPWYCWILSSMFIVLAQLSLSSLSAVSQQSLGSLLAVF